MRRCPLERASLDHLLQDEHLAKNDTLLLLRTGLAGRYSSGREREREADKKQMGVVVLNAANTLDLNYSNRRQVQLCSQSRSDARRCGAVSSTPAPRYGYRPASALAARSLAISQPGRAVENRYAAPQMHGM